MKTEIAAYIAGIIDGEGSIYCARSGGYYYPILEIGQSGEKGKNFLEWIKTECGDVGHVNSYKPGAKARTKLSAHAYIVTGKSIVTILEIVMPFLRLKKNQAIKAIEMTHLLKVHGNGRNNKLSQEDLAKRVKIGEEISKLNHSEKLSL